MNVCKATEDNYEETYGKELAGHDDRVYGEYLVRDYSNVWLRSPMTELSATAGMTQPEGTANTGFSTTLSATGRLVCDSNSETKTFSMYVEIPAGMEIDLDEAGAYVSGVGFLRTEAAPRISPNMPCFQKSQKMGNGILSAILIFRRASGCRIRHYRIPQCSGDTFLRGLSFKRKSLYSEFLLHAT